MATRVNGANRAGNQLSRQRPSVRRTAAPFTTLSGLRGEDRHGSTFRLTQGTLRETLPIRKHSVSFQRVQVSNKIIHVALGETPIESRHRAPSLDDGLTDLFVGRRRAAR